MKSPYFERVNATFQKQGYRVEVNFSLQQSDLSAFIHRLSLQQHFYLYSYLGPKNTLTHYTLISKYIVNGGADKNLDQVRSLTGRGHAHVFL